VIEEFGNEWTQFNHSQVDKEKLYQSFQQYFRIFPWHLLNEQSVGFDMGCGSGRWAQLVAPKVKTLNCVEPSQAIEVAKSNLAEFSNVNFLNETTSTCSLSSQSQDFGYSLGVLHHIPNTEQALADCARLLKPGAPFLLYLYYSFDNKPIWFKTIWKASDILRRLICRLPSWLKIRVCDVLALLIYWPLSRFAFVLEKVGFDVSNIPLSDYRDKPFYTCRNDALDRFGTRLEQRFSRQKITNMLLNNGFHDVTFSEGTPYWCCVSYKK
jgi:SAM-dependent methyltransferase